MTSVNSNLLDTDYTFITQNNNYLWMNQKLITQSAGSYIQRGSLFSSSIHVSPVIDTQRNSVITIENIINNLITNETNREGGDALARYITRRVTLKDGFDATDLKIYMTANRQAGTAVSCYYKVLSQFDSEIFDDKFWVLMQEETNTNAVSKSDDENEFLEMEFRPDASNTNYTVDTVTYDSFKTFAIKIVLSSSSTTRVPLIKDLRCIALA